MCDVSRSSLFTPFVVVVGGGIFFLGFVLGVPFQCGVLPLETTSFRFLLGVILRG